MLDGVWIDNESPILEQVSKEFNSAAFLFHPFVQMPNGWTASKKQHSYQHIYPNDEEILHLGKPVTWNHMLDKSGLSSRKELALALMTSIGALMGKYAKDDLAEMLRKSIETDLYYPGEDRATVFMLSSFLNVLAFIGSKKVYIIDQFLGENTKVNIEETTPLEISSSLPFASILTDENEQYAFMSMYDSFTTLFLSTEKDINHLVQAMNWEAFICDKNTHVGWFLRDE
ncbi:DUF2711 family protein [Paenalkalicoccus suaedae]|uniref:DUF2711 family protein n=1 Tax=Paenalkalicoccus suaedae TaxID=2592382 RepID=A0A859FJT1_9BACI|nr:DUF2711 family protein [Paenalkalicoccus suaedae]QKS73058.1 DUF2711 family protein [Paenalkalicoccus suaedae]